MVPSKCKFVGTAPEPRLLKKLPRSFEVASRDVGFIVARARGSRIDPRVRDCYSLEPRLRAKYVLAENVSRYCVTDSTATWTAVAQRPC